MRSSSERSEEGLVNTGGPIQRWIGPLSLLVAAGRSWPGISFPVAIGERDHLKPIAEYPIRAQSGRAVVRFVHDTNVGWCGVTSAQVQINSAWLRIECAVHAYG